MESFRILFFSILFLLVCSTSMLLGVYVISVHSKGSINRSFFTVCVFLCVWSFGFSIAVIAPDAEACLFWHRVSALSWSGIYAALLHFILILKDQGKNLRKKWPRFLLYLPAAVCAAVFSLLDDTAKAQYRFIHTDSGWVNTAVNSGWDFFFYACYAAYAAAGLILLWRWGKTADSQKDKTQAKIIFLSFALVIGLGSFTDLINRSFLLIDIPQMAPVFFLIPITVSYRCMKKYRFMSSPVKDEEIILNDSNRARIFHLASFALMIGGVAYFASQYLLAGQENLPSILFISVFLFLWGAAFQILQQLQIGQYHMEVIYIALISLSIPIFTVSFLHFSGTTIWAFSFIVIISSLVFNKRIVLTATTISTLLTQLYIWVRMPHAVVEISSGNYAGRIGILCVAIVFAFYVNRVYTLRLKENAQQVRIQKLVSEISSDFVTVNPLNVEEKIDAMLGKIKAFFKIDNTCLCLIRQEYGVFTDGYFCCHDRFEQENGVQGKACVQQAYYKKANRVVHIPDTRILPPDAEEIGQQLTRRHVQALLSIPITVKEETIGFLNLESVRSAKIWREDQINVLKVIANIAADALTKVKAEKTINFMAYYDSLTKLPNRLLFADRVKQAINLARRTEKFIGIIFLDLDSFKSVNDTLGHNGGDELIEKVAQKLSASVRKSDAVSRFGGDEFLIMLNHISEVTDVMRIAEKLMNLFNTPFMLNGQEMFMTASAGIALYPADGEDTETLVKNADIAMYHAKGKGKNQYALCSTDMKHEVQMKMKLTNGLYRALERNELVVYYQPQVSLQSEKIIGVEALLRWKHPELGMISPAVFIPLAEQTGLIDPIGEWVLRTACRQNKNWQEQGLRDIRMAVNLSVVQLRNPSLMGQIEKVLEETQLDPGLLELEITESATVKEGNFIVDILYQMKKLGIYISIDDFGTEYSSLSRLKSLPIDRLKMDIQFVRGIDKSFKDQAITKVIISLAKNLQLKLVAEGVENKMQLDFLKQRMCDEVQGFYYYKPMPAEEVEMILKSAQ